MSLEAAKGDASDFEVSEALGLLKRAMEILDDKGLDIAAAHVQMAIDCCKEQPISTTNG